MGRRSRRTIAHTFVGRLNDVVYLVFRRPSGELRQPRPNGGGHVPSDTRGRRRDGHLLPVGERGFGQVLVPFRPVVLGMDQFEKIGQKRQRG